MKNDKTYRTTIIRSVFHFYVFPVLCWLSVPLEHRMRLQFVPQRSKVNIFDVYRYR